MGCDPNALTASSALKCDIYLNYFKLFKSALKSPTGPFVDPMMKKKSTFCFSAVLGLQKSWAGSGGKSHAAHPGRDPLALASGADSRRANGDVVAGYSCGVGGGASRGLGQPRDDPCTPLRCHTEKRHRPGPAVLCPSPQAPGTHWSPYCLRSFASSRMS